MSSKRKSNVPEKYDSTKRAKLEDRHTDHYGEEFDEEVSRWMREWGVRFLIRPEGSDGANLLGKGQYGTVQRILLLPNHSNGLRYESQAALKVARTYPSQAMHELKLLTCISHPNIVGCWSTYGPVDKMINKEMRKVGYSIQELLPGGTVEEMTDRYDDIIPPEPLGRGILEQVGHGLMHLHSTSVDSRTYSHGDIDRSNVMFDKHGTVKLIDLGLGEADENQSKARDIYNWIHLLDVSAHRIVRYYSQAFVHLQIEIERAKLDYDEMDLLVYLHSQWFTEDVINMVLR